jgi:hypothetical protein
LLVKVNARRDATIVLDFIEILNPWRQKIQSDPTPFL